MSENTVEIALPFTIEGDDSDTLPTPFVLVSADAKSKAKEFHSRKGVKSAAMVKALALFNALVKVEENINSMQAIGATLTVEQGNKLIKLAQENIDVAALDDVLRENTEENRVKLAELIDSVFDFVHANIKVTELQKLSQQFYVKTLTRKVGDTTKDYRVTVNVTEIKRESESK